MDTTDPEFWKQFAGSGTANIVTVLGIGLLMGLKKLCERDTRCKSHVHCCCLDFDVRDKTMRSSPESSDKPSVETI